MKTSHLNIQISIFSLIKQKGKKLSEPRVAVRKRAKQITWAKLGSGAKAPKRVTSPNLVSNNLSTYQVPLFLGDTIKPI